MRTVNQCLKLKSSFNMTVEERRQFEDWLKTDARYMVDSYDYCVLLGWFHLDRRIPLSPKEVGFD
ncbi:hypothetical protein VPIG_00045 [Vibrio phage PWH3a-P1]|uniref:hypothetical protein n=1 Tax=Vibrio phage PWH3a-P1 TaxID=754058 RepID=UPI0002C0882D|nr:hypothetical protein VPIG_00045 [Vibrio phage PWH3a-P1]AGH31903.1 hypothetical protein VPIG_00045 [Vibrio phage PWH3a-P1]